MNGPLITTPQQALIFPQQGIPTHQMYQSVMTTFQLSIKELKDLATEHVETLIDNYKQGGYVLELALYLRKWQQEGHWAKFVRQRWLPKGFGYQSWGALPTRRSTKRFVFCNKTNPTASTTSA